MNPDSSAPFLLDYPGHPTAATFSEGYANFITPPVVEAWNAHTAREAAKVAEEYTIQCDLAYGPKPSQTLDFFPALDHPETAPTLLYLHGGLWFLSDKRDTYLLAPGFVRHGVNFITINYSLAPHVDLTTIVEECRQALAWVHAHATELGIDPQKFIVSGHSAAGQLCTVMNSTDWAAYRSGLPANLVKGCLGISGFYDIEPIPGTFVDAATKIPHEQYPQHNPLRLVRSGLPPVLLVLGAKESWLLQEMTHGYGTKFQEAGNPAAIWSAEGEDHFSVLTEMSRAGSPLHRQVIDWIVRKAGTTKAPRHQG